MPIDLIEFPADDLARARQFWEGLLGLALDGRSASEGQGLQSHGDGPALGLHERGRGPGDRFSLPYFRVADMSSALERVVELGGPAPTARPRDVLCRWALSGACPRATAGPTCGDDLIGDDHADQDGQQRPGDGQCRSEGGDRRDREAG